MDLKTHNFTNSDIKSEGEIKKLREAGHITGGILDRVLNLVEVKSFLVCYQQVELSSI